MVNGLYLNVPGRTYPNSDRTRGSRTGLQSSTEDNHRLFNATEGTYIISVNDGLPELMHKLEFYRVEKFSCSGKMKTTTSENMLQDHRTAFKLTL